MTIQLVENPDGKAAELYEAVKKKIGKVPNIFKAFAHSPATLASYLSQSEELAKGLLDPQLREQIAIVVAGTNHCNYCASVHSLLGKGLGLANNELHLNLKGESLNEKTKAALQFAKAIVDKKGHLNQEVLNDIRQVGYSEGEIVEIIAHVGMNIFTNYFNHIAGTEIDFPLVNTQD